MLSDFTVPEIIRVVCYTIAPVAAFYVALKRWHIGLRHEALFFAMLVLMFAWSAIEISLTANGVATREYRVLATPVVVLLTLFLVAVALLESKRHA